MVAVVFAVQEFMAFAGHIRAEVQAIDQACVTFGAPLVEVVVDERGGGDPVGFDDSRLVPMGSVHEDARRDNETGVKGAAIVDHVEDMIFDRFAPGGQSFLELFGGPPMNVEDAVEDYAGIEDLTQWGTQVAQVVIVRRLEVADLVEGPDSAELGLDVAGKGDIFAHVAAGEHWTHRRFHKGSFERT